jgi:hypothetical protein
MSAAALRDGNVTGARPRPRSPVVENLIRLVETVGLPIGLVSGFLVFFGATYSNSFYNYFGITPGLLQHSVQSQLLQSAQPLFGTTVLVLALVAGLWVLDRLTAPLRGRPEPAGRRTSAAILAAGMLPAVAGLLAAVKVPPFAETLSPRVASLAMLAGALCILRVRQPLTDSGRSPERVLLVVAAVLAVFWVATVYATEAGNRIARQVDRSPGRLPLATLFIGEYLDLPGSSVTVTENPSPAGDSIYRYTGLRLLTYSADRWFLVTGTYDGYRPAVTVLPDQPGLRVEIARQD